MIDINIGVPAILIKEPRLLGYSTKVIELASRAGLKSRLMGGTNAVLQGLPRAKTLTGMKSSQLFG